MLQRSCARLGRQWDTSMQAHMLATSHAIAQLQAFQPIKTPYALHVHGPAVTSKQHMDATIAVTADVLGRARACAPAVPPALACDFDTPAENARSTPADTLV